MRQAFLIVVLFLLAAPLVALAQSGQSCPNVCPEGTILSDETGKCEPYKPLMV